MSKSTPKSRSQTDTTTEDLHELLREAEMALSEAGDQASEKVVALRDRLRDALAEGKDVVKDLASSARRQAAQADEVIRANPYAAIGVAVGVGALVGCLIARSCCQRN